MQPVVTQTKQDAGTMEIAGRRAIKMDTRKTRGDVRVISAGEPYLSNSPRRALVGNFPVNVDL